MYMHGEVGGSILEETKELPVRVRFSDLDRSNLNQIASLDLFPTSPRLGRDADTTMIGFVPLLLGGGKFWPPLAVAIAGGVGGATLLALLLVPSAYLLLSPKKDSTLVKKN